MVKKHRILAIIPARGGSKRLPGKNIKKLHGIPMIAYAINAARHSKYVDKLIVSTDDKQIARISKKFGADIPFIRPWELATDTAKTVDVLFHAINYFETEKSTSFDYIVLIQPTSPLIQTQDIDDAIKKIIKTKKQSCVSVCEISERPEWLYSIKNNSIVPFSSIHNINLRSQELPKLFRINGAIYVSSKQLIKNRKILDEQSLEFILMPRERSIDIDTIHDFKQAEFLLSERK